MSCEHLFTFYMLILVHVFIRKHFYLFLLKKKKNIYLSFLIVILLIPIIILCISLFKEHHLIFNLNIGLDLCWSQIIIRRECVNTTFSSTVATRMHISMLKSKNMTTYYRLKLIILHTLSKKLQSAFFILFTPP